MGYPNDQGNPAGAIPVYLAGPPGAKSQNITTATTTTLKTGAGTFLGISVNTPQSGATATVYDNTAGSGTKLGTFSLATQGPINMPGAGIPFATGLTVVTVGATPADITVSYV